MFCEWTTAGTLLFFTFLSRRGGEARAGGVEMIEGGQGATHFPASFTFQNSASLQTLNVDAKLPKLLPDLQAAHVCRHGRGREQQGSLQSTSQRPVDERWFEVLGHGSAGHEVAKVELRVSHS